jgi:hypothetical protein
MFRGGSAKAYRETVWTDGSDLPTSFTWDEIKRFVDVSMSNDAGSADVSSRLSEYEQTVNGLKNATITAGYRVKQGADTQYTNFTNAYLNNTKLLIAVMDQNIATSGAKGWRGIYRVQAIGEEQPLADGAMTNMTLAPTPGFDASGDLIDIAYITTP